LVRRHMGRAGLVAGNGHQVRGIPSQRIRQATRPDTRRKNANLTPSGGVADAVIAPPDGAGRALTTPSDGAINSTFGTRLTPSDGEYLDIAIFPTERN
jgi:hypothetical protein